MKTLRSLSFCLLFLLPFTSFGQNQQLNPPSQQSVNLYGGTDLDNNPQSKNNIDNNEFVIHEVVQSNKLDEGIFTEQQVSIQNKHNFTNPISFGSGATSGGVKKNLNRHKAKQRFDKKIHRFFYRTHKKNRSNTSCFSWSWPAHKQPMLKMFPAIT